jgi:hypothetical protein
MIGIASALLAAAVVGAALLIVLFDRRTAPPRAQRVGLSMMAAGLLWAAPARMLGGSPGLGDLIFLLGLLVLLAALYGARLVRGLDAVDGHVDGRLGVIPLHASGPRSSALRDLPTRRGLGVAPPPRR